MPKQSDERSGGVLKIAAGILPAPPMQTLTFFLFPFFLRSRVNEGEHGFCARVKMLQREADLGCSSALMIPRLNRKFQSFKPSRKMNRCLREGLSPPARDMSARALLLSSFYHFKIGQADAAPLLYYIYDKHRPLLWMFFVLRGGKIRSCSSN